MCSVFNLLSECILFYFLIILILFVIRIQSLTLLEKIAISKIFNKPCNMVKCLCVFWVVLCDPFRLTNTESRSGLERNVVSCIRIKQYGSRKLNDSEGFVESFERNVCIEIR